MEHFSPPAAHLKGEGCSAGDCERPAQRTKMYLWEIGHCKWIKLFHESDSLAAATPEKQVVGDISKEKTVIAK